MGVCLTTLGYYFASVMSITINQMRAEFSYVLHYYKVSYNGTFDILTLWCTNVFISRILLPPVCHLFGYYEFVIVLASTNVTVGTVSLPTGFSLAKLSVVTWNYRCQFNSTTFTESDVLDMGTWRTSSGFAASTAV